MNSAASDESTMETSETSRSDSSPLTTLLAVLVFGGFIALGVLVLYRIYPNHVPSKANPGFIDNIFHSNLVVFATRLVLLSIALVFAFVGAFVITSIVNSIRKGQWLTRAGSFEVSQHAVTELQQAATFWQSQALALNNQVEELTQHLEESDALLASLLEEDGEEVDGESEKRTLDTDADDSDEKA